MLNQINNYTFKSFNNYTGPTDNPFKQKNILFGYNGKGKSSLSKGILMEYTKDKLITKENYRFFDKNYIKNNLLLENSNEIKGIVANFGEKNVDIEKEISEKKKNLVNISLLEEELSTHEKIIRKEIDNIFDSKKGKSTIKKKNAENIHELINAYQKDLDPALKLVSNKDELRNIKDSFEYEKELENIQKAKIITFDLINENEINNLLLIMNSTYNENEIPTTKILSWLQQGLEIHKEENSSCCKFCGHNIKLDEIENKITAYLDDKKQQDLLILDSINNKINKILNQKQQLEDNKILFEKLIGENVLFCYEEIQNQINDLSKINDIINAKLDEFEKAKNINIDLINEINNSIQNNLTKLNDLKKLKEQEITNIINKSNILIKGSIAYEIINSQLIKSEHENYNLKIEEIAKQQQANDKLLKEINDLKNVKSTTGDFALFINELLDYLGIEFLLDVTDNNYVIKHKKDKTIITIDDISEGENNLLALLFFYYELFDDNKQNKFKDNIKVIIIDDPISSVDDINKVYVLELIKKIILIESPQVFVFTHVWDDFCNLCYGKKDKETTPYRFYEIKKNENGSYIKKIKYNETPYMHDFKEIFEFSNKTITEDLDECEIYHYPNVMRKILEEYMKFKVSNSSPTLDNINNVKIALCGSVNNCNNNDNIQIPTLLDVCNIYSHKSARNPEQILKSAKYLMRKIKEIDNNHFSTMTK